MRRRDKYRYKLVWDTSALINMKEPNAEGYSPGYSLWKDLFDVCDGRGPYLNIIPAVAAFEVPAAVSGKRRGGGGMSHDFYLLGDHEVLYPIGRKLISATHKLRTSPFDQLRGADLIFACIAKHEDACLVTLDSHFLTLRGQVTVIDLNDSRDMPRYRESFEKNWPVGGLVRP